MVEFWSPPGDLQPLHCHDLEDEVLFVLEGRIALHQPGRRREAGVGESLIAERGIPHAYEVLDADGARYLVVCVPGGFERFVRALGRRPNAVGLPEPSDPDPRLLAPIARRHGIELLGPPGTLP
jgi:hypothetical protein